MYLEQLSSMQCTYSVNGCLFAGVACQGLAERLVWLAERERASFKMPAVMMVFWALVRLEVRQNRMPSHSLPIPSNKRCNSATLHLNINKIWSCRPLQSWMCGRTQCPGMKRNLNAPRMKFKHSLQLSDRIALLSLCGPMCTGLMDPAPKSTPCSALLEGAHRNCI